ncbi:DUF6541 family protein [Kutzneria sp. CA-103260]|uniref:DUF6541 family protein n=1 Tax=Kutzneria sp. CA-103260 TaxID=2802641 RepID=UPI001BA947A0|nr:DUF6541 family protein [Kutzneria sp. CA-103260]QUQ69841.1 hypothetical protein JJ691_76080 [Kutzneria sp. CA-103260]
MIMSWFDAVPAALLCACWLLLPGLPVTYLLGLRGVAAWGFAPTVAVGTIGLTAVIAPMAGLTWGFLPPIVVSAILVALIGLYRLIRRRPSSPVDPLAVTGAAAIGMVPAVLLGLVTMARSIPGGPNSVSQTYDAVFHYNAVRLILNSGNGSSLAIGALGQPGVAGGFYPAAWHDLVALVVGGSCAAIPVATNATAAVVASLAWPLACLLLVRQVVGPSRLAMGVTGVLSLAFGAFPWGLLGFGVLWPNTLGLSLLPAGFAAVLSVTGLARQDVLGRGRAWFLLVVSGVAGAIAHPNTIFSLAALSIIPVLIGVVGWAKVRRAAGHARQAYAAVGGVVLLMLGAAVFADRSPIFNDVKSITWPAIESPAQSIGEVLLNAPNGKNAAWVLSAFTLIGLVVAARRGSGRRWLVADHVLSGVMFLLAATLNSPLSHHIVGYWYNDSFRLAAVLPVTALPATVLGVQAVIAWLRDRIETTHSETWRARLQPALKSTVAIPAIVLLVLVVGTKGLYSGQHSLVVAATYGQSDNPRTQPLLNADRHEFFDRIGREVPANATIASNPWNGSALLWSLEDRQVLVPHFAVTMGADEIFLSKHLDDAARNPLVCQAAGRLHVQYLYVDTVYLWPGDKRTHDYPGLADPTGKAGFELVDQQGQMKLFRITACAAA